MLGICCAAVMGMAKGTKEPCRKLSPLKEMCPQPAQERLRGAHRAQNFPRLCSQCPGEWHRLSTPRASVATVPQTQQEPKAQQHKALPSDLIPSSAHDFSTLQAQTTA